MGKQPGGKDQEPRSQGLKERNGLSGPHMQAAKMSCGLTAYPFGAGSLSPQQFFPVLFFTKGSRWCSDHSKERPDTRKGGRQYSQCFLFPKKSSLTHCLAVSPRLP